MRATDVYSTAEISRFALRIMLLTIGSGLHHLPDGGIPESDLQEAKAGVRSAYDFLVAGGQTRVVSLLLARSLKVLKQAGIDPMEIYTHATVARVGKAEASHLIPIDCGGAVVEFPSPARAFIQSDKIRQAAAEDRRMLYAFVMRKVEEIAFNAHLLTGKPQSAFKTARDFAHNGETFLAQSRLVGGELRTVEPAGPSIPGFRPIDTEGEFLRRLAECVADLRRHGLGPETHIPSASVLQGRASSPLSDGE